MAIINYYYKINSLITKTNKNHINISFYPIKILLLIGTSNFLTNEIYDNEKIKNAAGLLFIVLFN